MIDRLRRRKGQEGFTLIELLVVVLIIGILAAIAIPAFLGQKKGAQDSNAKSLLRNAAIAMESYYSENQSFDAVGAAVGTPVTAAELLAIEPNMNWTVGAAPAVAAATTLAKGDNVHVTPAIVAPSTVNNEYTMYVTSASGGTFSYVRDEDAAVTKCKDPSGAAWDTACAANEW